MVAEDEVVATEKAELDNEGHGDIKALEVSEGLRRHHRACQQPSNDQNNCCRSSSKSIAAHLDACGHRVLIPRLVGLFQLLTQKPSVSGKEDQAEKSTLLD